MQSAVEVRAVVAEVELTVDEPDVCFGRGEAVVEGVEERPVVLVVVVGVSPLEGLHAGAWRLCHDRSHLRLGGWRAGRGSGRCGSETGAEQRGEKDGRARERHTSHVHHPAPIR